MGTNIFVNLPVKDLQKSVHFFGELGFAFNQQFTDEKAACMVIGDESYVMLLVEDFFKTFTKKDLTDASKQTEAILAISAESREAVDELVSKAFDAGAQPSNPAMDEGFMYSCSFQDLDGHLWEVLYMDPAAIEQ